MRPKAFQEIGLSLANRLIETVFMENVDANGHAGTISPTWRTNNGLSVMGDLVPHRVLGLVSYFFDRRRSNEEQHVLHTMTYRACGVDVTGIGRVEANELHFETDLAALTPQDHIFGPNLPKQAVLLAHLVQVRFEFRCCQGEFS